MVFKYEVGVFFAINYQNLGGQESFFGEGNLLGDIAKASGQELGFALYISLDVDVVEVVVDRASAQL